MYIDCYFCPLQVLATPPAAEEQPEDMSNICISQLYVLANTPKNVCWHGLYVMYIYHQKWMQPPMGKTFVSVRNQLLGNDLYGGQGNKVAIMLCPSSGYSRKSLSLASCTPWKYLLKNNLFLPMFVSRTSIYFQQCLDIFIVVVYWPVRI